MEVGGGGGMGVAPLLKMMLRPRKPSESGFPIPHQKERTS